jgi:hypothetical protein
VANTEGQPAACWEVLDAFRLDQSPIAGFDFFIPSPLLLYRFQPPARQVRLSLRRDAAGMVGGTADGAAGSSCAKQTRFNLMIIALTEFFKSRNIIL